MKLSATAIAHVAVNLIGSNASAQAKKNGNGARPTFIGRQHEAFYERQEVGGEGSVRRTSNAAAVEREISVVQNYIAATSHPAHCQLHIYSHEL